MQCAMLHTRQKNIRELVKDDTVTIANLEGNIFALSSKTHHLVKASESEDNSEQTPFAISVLQYYAHWI